MNTPDKHQLKIAFATLNMTDAGALMMGGMTKEEARSVIAKHNKGILKTRKAKQ